MSEQTKDQLTDHLYDGIEEYDNPTPGWWTWLFIGTIVFGMLYWFISTITFGQLSAPSRLEVAKNKETVRLFGSLGELKPDAKTILKFANDVKWLTVGKNLYLSKCAACHARDGSGINGANLTDEKYIHINKVEDIVDVIASGRANGAMPAWRNQMNENEIIMVSAYVASLRGQNLPGRAPEANAKEISAWHE